MEIILYKNLSENNKMTKNLTQLSILLGTLKESCSVTNPVILVESPSFITANYAYIHDFGRYYFIKEVVCESTTLWRISMHCDVLSSFKNEINECEATINRQEYAYNLYLPDSLYPITEKTFFTTQTIGRSFEENNRNVLLLSNCGGGTPE